MAWFSMLEHLGEEEIGARAAGHIATMGSNKSASLQKIFRATGWQKDAQEEALRGFRNGNIDSSILSKGMDRKSLWGGGDLKGEQGAARAWGAMARHGDNTRVLSHMEDQLSEKISNLEKNGAVAEADKAEHAHLSKQLQSVRAEKNSVGRYLGTAKTVAGGTLDWMLGGSLGQKATKIGTVAGAYVGTAGAIRGMTTGGNMFYDGDGRSSIAGLPF